MFFHHHVASIHYGISTAKSIDITTMMLHNSSEHNQIIDSERNVLSDAYHNSIVQVLSAHRILNNQDQTQTILQEINNCVHTELQSNHFKSCPINISALVNIRQFELSIGGVIPLSRIYLFHQLVFETRLLTSQ